MTSRGMRRSVMAFLVVAAAVAAGPALRAQEPPAPPPPTPVVIVGNTQFTPLFEDVTLMPGERAERDLDVGTFTSVRLLAAATAEVPANGRVAVVQAFGPPPVPLDARLGLGFRGGTEAHGSSVQPVLGPHLHIGVANMTNQKVTLNLSVYAAK